MVLLLAAAAGAGAWWFGEGRFVAAPGVVNLSARAAEARVEAAGLTFDVGGQAYSETIPPGSVVRTDPAGGENVTRDGTVTAILSRGPERHPVPALTGLTLDEAQSSIADSALSYGEATYRYSERVARGVVLRSDPVAATRLRRSGVVDLVLSRGPRPIKVADFTGKDADEATQALEKLGFKVTATSENNDTVEEGDVISQSPDDGRLFRDDPVELVVSKGPVLVDVPSVVSRSTEAATSLLEAQGFEVRTERVDVYIGLGVVVRQSPGGGDRSPRGSTVTLYVV